MSASAVPQPMNTAVRGRVLAAFFLAMLAIALQACALKPETVPRAARTGQGWICEAFRPIALSGVTDVETRLQMEEHNAAWQVLCGVGDDAE